MRALALAMFVLGCAPSTTPAASAILSVSVEQQSAWVRNFNPLVAEGARWPTRSGIYEPLLIWNTVTARWVPWLATSHAWSSDLKRLRFTLRPDVTWSDGAPFGADDVVCTFEILRRTPALDAYGTWSFVTSVRAVDAHTVEFALSRPYVPGLADLAQQPIVPAHVWKQIADPLTFTNPHPIATGPFTEVRVFRNQVYELARNPHYWQHDKPAVAALRMIAYPSNDQANLALVEGEVDWGGNYVPAIQRTFVDRDRAHHGFWYPALGAMVYLYPNHARAPFADARVRKALSLAIDRRRVAAVALAGFAHPTDGTGLTDAYAAWRDPQLAADAWVRYDAPAAERLLDEAGLPRGSDGWRRGRDGKRLTFDIEVVSGWSDWVRAGQLVARDLGHVGIDAKLRTYEFSAWFARLQAGDFDLSIGWSVDGPTPYYVYRGLMASSAVKPVGELAAANWHRFGDAGADELLGAFERTEDPARQRAIVAQLEARFIATAPAIPLFGNPLWGAFNTRRFVGFPTAADAYAKLSPHSDPERLLVLTSLKPRGR